MKRLAVLSGVALVAGAAVVLFVSSAFAQQPQRVHRVGVLNFGIPAYSIVASPINARLVERLEELGHRKGENLILERAADLVAKLLRGAKPHALPIEQATRVYLTVNLKSARPLGQTIPTALLHRADFVIE